MPKPAVAVATLKLAVAAVIGGPFDLLPITEGEESRAFRVRQGGNEYVVRVNRSAAGFAKDAFTARRFAGPALPTPTVLHIGQLDDGLAFCISERMPGRTLQDLAPLELLPLLAPTARVLDAIATTDVSDTSGYGPFDGDGAGEFATWREFLLTIVAPERYDWPATERRRDRSRIARCLRRIEQHIVSCPEERRLIHGDFGSNNVLANGARITGVIDWSEAMFGDPLYDLANVLFWRTWLACMEQQAHYFQATLSAQPRLRERLQCYQLRIGLDTLYQAAITGETRLASWTLSPCAAIEDESSQIDAIG